MGAEAGAGRPLLAGTAARSISPLPEHLDADVYLGGYGFYGGRRACGRLAARGDREGATVLAGVAMFADSAPALPRL